MTYLHAAGKSKSFFEGWYFKHQLGLNTIAFIPGINIDTNGRRNAFIQIITNEGSFQTEYDYSEFQADKKKLMIKVGKSIFTNEGISVDIQKDGISCKGRINYGQLTPIKYNIMGPFGLVPFMECNHGIISLFHTLDGDLTWNGTAIGFENGIGYIEKDWGSSFPKNYSWVQCNDFSGNDLYISASVASIPFLGSVFEGCICIVYFCGKEYRLATYTGAKVIKREKDCLIIRQGKYTLEVKVTAQSAHNLLAPHQGMMSRTIRESSSCGAVFKFYDQQHTFFERKSNTASFEFVQTE